MRNEDDVAKGERGEVERGKRVSSGGAAETRGVILSRRSRGAGGAVERRSAAKDPPQTYATCPTTLSPAAVDEVAERFRVLGEPLRVRLIQELQDGEKSVGELVTALGATQSNVSKHLRIIQAAGLAGRRHEGNLVYYFMTDRSVFALCDAVCASVGERLTRDARLGAELNRSGNRRR